MNGPSNLIDLGQVGKSSTHRKVITMRTCNKLYHENIKVDPQFKDKHVVLFACPLCGMIHIKDVRELNINESPGFSVEELPQNTACSSCADMARRHPEIVEWVRRVLTAHSFYFHRIDKDGKIIPQG